MKPFDRLAVTILLAALVLTGAGMLVPPAASQVVTPPAVNVVGYREGVLGRPVSITPFTAQTQADRDLVALLLRGLLHLGPDGTLLPDLASGWTAATDGTSYTFSLRQDRFWDDGALVTADDVMYTVGLVQDPAYKGTLAARWRSVKAVRVDRFTVRFELGVADASFLQATTLPLLPSHALTGIPYDKLAASDIARQPLGDGPFRLVDLDENAATLQRVTEAGPKSISLGAAPTPPGTLPVPSLAHPTVYDGILDMELRFYDDASAMAADFAAGRLDAVGGLPPDAVQAALRAPGSRLVRYPRTTLTEILLNQRGDHPEFRTPDARLGMLQAIDRDALVGGPLAGYATRAEIPVLPSSWAYQPAAVTPVRFDRDAATASLARAGWQLANGKWTAAKGSAPIVVRLLAPDEATNPTTHAAADEVASAWTAIGVTVTVRALPAAEYVKALAAAEFDAAIVDVDLGLDPDLSPLLLSSQAAGGGLNVSGVQNATLDRLLTAARSAMDRESRIAALGSLETYLSANAPLLPLYFRDYPFVVSTRLQHVRSHELPDPSSRFWDVLDWRLANDG